MKKHTGKHFIDALKSLESVKDYDGISTTKAKNLKVIAEKIRMEIDDHIDALEIYSDKEAMGALKAFLEK